MIDSLRGEHSEGVREMNAIDRVQRLLEALKPLEGWPVSVGIWDDRRLDALVIQIELEIGEGRERIRRVLDLWKLKSRLQNPVSGS